MRDGALWIMLIIGAMAIGPGWGKAYDALAEDVGEWIRSAERMLD